MPKPPSPEDGRRLRLGERALRAGLLSETQLNHALAQQAQEAKGGRLPRQLGVILLSLGFLAEEDLIALLSQQEKEREKEKIVPSIVQNKSQERGTLHRDSLRPSPRPPMIVRRPSEKPGPSPYSF